MSSLKGGELGETSGRYYQMMDTVERDGIPLYS